MEKWEYLETIANADRLTEMLEKYGDGGWELVNFVPGMYTERPPGGSPNPAVKQWWVGGFHLVFKRRKP
jgi:hypothetical protein